MIGSFIAVFVMAMLYEGLKIFRELVQQRKVKFYAIQIWNIVCGCKFNKTTEILSSPAYGTMEKKSM